MSMKVTIERVEKFEGEHSCDSRGMLAEPEEQELESVHVLV